ncbi:MAG: hypothetical protein AAF607_13270 [Pseudomonadota bacterium]
MMIRDDERALAQAAAKRLSADMPAGFPEAVEAALAAPGGSGQVPRAYDAGTTIALGALLVSIAQFAWTIYTDLRKQTAKPDREVLARRIRLRLEQSSQSGGEHTHHMVEAVVEEITQDPP